MTYRLEWHSYFVAMTVLNIWLLVAYLLVLAFLTFHKDRWNSAEPLRRAWVAFAGIPLTMAVFALIRVGNFGSQRDLMLTEIWQNGFVWLFLGLSVLKLSGLLMGNGE